MQITIAVKYFLPCKKTFLVCQHRRRVQTVSKHIVSNESLTGGRIRISVNKSSCSGIIIAGLEVIEAALFVVVVSTVTERVFLGQDTGSGQDLAVGVVSIGGNGIATGIHHAHDITLQIRDVIIGYAIDLHSIRLAGVVVEEVVGFRLAVGRYLLLQQLPAGVNVAVSGGGFRIDDLVACEDTSKLCTIGR